LGISKTEAAVRHLRSLANDVEIVGYAQGVQADMVEEFTAGCDIIVDEIDPYPLDRHVILHREANKRNLPIYSVYLIGLGIHFYKFQGNAYTFEDFINCPQTQWDKAPLDLLARRFGPPLPSYLHGEGLSQFQEAAKTGGVPSLVSSVLLGQSILLTRLIADIIVSGMTNCGTIAAAVRKKPTPIMPNYLVLDPIDMTLEIASIT
jgi:molybdopterin/thiamine biosynthesis adenylyltransferase